MTADAIIVDEAEAARYATTDAPHSPLSRPKVMRNSVASLQQKVTASGSSPLTWRIGAWMPLATSDG